jgi:predicted MFS family arabinose efflux permease
MFVRGLFFLTRYELSMSDGQNLILALSSGFAYIIGAQISHHAGTRFSEKKIIIVLILIQAFLPVLCYFYNSFLPLCMIFALFSLANGMTWPFAESYASAGLDEKQSSSSIGIYNICWSVAVPLGVWTSSWLISFFGKKELLFVVVSVLVAFIVSLFLPKKIPHVDTIALLEPIGEAKIFPNAKAMMLSGRLSMCYSYALMQLLASLLPGRFYALGISVASAGFITGFIDVARIVAFSWMSFTHCWHGKRILLLLCSPALAIAFVMCMFSDTIWIILIGEIIFGVTAALSYYAALFYVMLIGNSQVNAGASHESIIGVGFIFGPLVGIGAERLVCITNIGLSGTLLGFAFMSVLAIPTSIYFLLDSKKQKC